MIFEPEKLNQNLEPRIVEVECNELKELYDSPPAEDLIFKVRGLLGNDVAMVSAVRDSPNFIEMLSNALATKNGKQGAEAVRSLLGIFDDKLHPELRYRVELVVRGAVEPKIDYPLAAKMAADFYVVLNRLSEKVLELTGLGSQIKKKSSPDSKTTLNS